MSTNTLANYASPSVEGIGQITVGFDNSSFFVLRECITADLARAIAESGGMTGQKYREMLFRKVFAMLSAELGNSFTARDIATKNMRFTVVMIALGALLGTTASKNTLVKTMAITMEEREQDDAMGIAWRIIKSGFRTYVNEPSANQSLFPSVKFGSCAPEFALLGVCCILARITTADSLVADLARPFVEWPAILRKQWIGNFALSKEMQMEHMVWERTFWTSQVSTTNNASNKSFKKEFNADYYKTTIADKFLILLPNGQLVVPAATGYTKAQFAKAVIYIVVNIMSNAHLAYRIGGNIMTYNGNSVMNAVPARNLPIASLANPAGLSNASNTALAAITSAAAPAEVLSSTDSSLQALVVSINATSFTITAGP